MPILQVEGKQIELTNLKKVLWPKLGLTKGDLIEFYIQIAPYLLKYVKNRPITMVPYPHGIKGQWYYQKNLPQKRPPWLSYTSLKHKRKTIYRPLIKGLPDLIWMANRGCIEVHTWFSQIDSPLYPDLAVFDLDPSPMVDFSLVLKVALVIKEILEGFSLKSYPKTSGKKGLHIYIPINREYTYPQIRKFVRQIGELVLQILPESTTLQWLKAKRHGVYLDYRQNGEGKTLAAPYSLRPTEEANVSTPIPWSLVERGTFLPRDFRLKTIFEHLNDVGDPFMPIIEEAQTLPQQLL